MNESIQRPLSLTPELSTIFGNERSQQMVKDAYGEGFSTYCELIQTDWSHEDAMGASRMVIIGSLESKVHQLAAELDDEQ